MKTKIIKVDIPDFCPKNCTEFELEKIVLHSSKEPCIFFKCMHVAFCDKTHVRGDNNDS